MDTSASAARADTEVADPVWTQTKPSAARSTSAVVGFVAAVVFTAVLGILTNRGNVEGWYADADKVAWNPPPSVFGPAWTILYVLIAVAGFLLWRRGYRGIGRENEARSLLILFVAQLVLNALWSPFFFAGYPLIGEAGWWIALVIIVVLDILVASLVIASLREHGIVALLLLPYLGWLLFATTLNAGIIALN